MHAANIYFAIMVGMLMVALVVALIKQERIYEYPYFMAVVFAVFIVPQAVSLIRFPGEAQSEWVANVLLMACLCFAMCWLGYILRPLQSVQRLVAQPVNRDRLFQGGLVFICVSFFFYHLLSQMTPEEKGGTQWTGPSTIYLFFANLIYPAFAICLYRALRTHSFLAWGATVIAAIQPLQTSIVGGRRERTVQFLLTLALTLYYQRGTKPPRWTILGLIAGAMIAIPATGTYRGLAAQHEWEQVSQMDLVGNFRQYLSQESILELRNAAVIIEGTRRSKDYQWGAGYWDQVVLRFVPAQLLGREFKASLMFQPGADRMDYEIAKLGYAIPTGSTPTGVADSFRQFGWFGCLFFGVLGMFFRSLFQATQQPNAIFAQLFYIQIGTSAMRAATHQTVDFLPGIIYYAVFLGLLYLYARERTPKALVRRARRRSPITQQVEQCPSVNPPLTPPRRGTRMPRTNNRRLPSRGPPAQVAAPALPSSPAAHPPDGRGEPRESGASEGL